MTCATHVRPPTQCNKSICAQPPHTQRAAYRVTPTNHHGNWSNTCAIDDPNQSPAAMTTHAPTITTPLPPHTTSKPQQSQRTKHHHNLNVVVVPDARTRRTHSHVTTRRGRLSNSLVHSRARRSRVHNRRRTATACTVQSCLVLVSATRLRCTLVAECLSDGGPGDVSLTVSGGDGLSASLAVHLEHVTAIPLTGHLTVNVRAGGQAGRSGGLNRTNPKPPRKRDLAGVTPPQVGNAPILLEDERTPLPVPHCAGIPQARPELLVFRLARRSLRHVNGGTRTGEHPTASGGGLLSRVGGHTTHQAHNPKHQGHHHAPHCLAHLRVPSCSPRRRGCVADAQNCTPHEHSQVNPQPPTHNVTYTIEHTYTHNHQHTHARARN